jgi:glycosyltransferase involved in cell wall biosynthesis
VNYLERLLKSIDSQSYTNFEVIITDDSGEDTAVEKFIHTSNFTFNIFYFKNNTSLGSPMNWQAAISHAKGDWIKIMHDDDYFATSTSLQHFVDKISEGSDCIFSGYNAVFEDRGTINMTISKFYFNRVVKNPFLLFAKNIIGPPSVLMFKKTISERFDKRLKWIVDWEYYIRLSLKYKLIYIKEPLICVSYNSSQITNFVKGDPQIEIYESMLFFEKYDLKMLNSILVYDAWWRLMRNLGIRSVDDFSVFHKKEAPSFLKDIIVLQSFFSLKFLKIGFLSKLLMFMSYVHMRIFS